jgi:FMN-dependent NADH-azoreductase
MPPVKAEWVGAVYTPEQARTPRQKELLSLSDSLLAELDQADEYVIGVPMHNFGVPSVLKLWIDQIALVGRAFSYGERGPKGLIIGKKATSSSRRAGSTTPRRRWPRSISWNRICGPYLVFLA